MNTTKYMWLLLFVAGLFEVFWAVSLKLSNGFSSVKWSILALAGMVISMGLLSFCLKSLPMGSAYAIWTGIGAAGTAILGIMLFQETKDPLRLLFLGLIIIGIIGLRLTTKS